LRLTWKNRDRLDARGLAWLQSWMGPRFPEPPFDAELLAGRERLVELAKDNGEAWFTLGDKYYHEGRYLGYEDWAERARSAMERSLALDASSAEPLGHLIDLATWRGDTAEVRRLAPLYLATEGARRGPYSMEVRWYIAHMLRDEALRSEVWATFDTAGRVPEDWPVRLQLHGGDPRDVERLIALYDRRTSTRREKLEHTLVKLTVLSNMGRPRAALALIDSSPFVPPPLAAAVHLQVALFTGISDSQDVARAASLAAALTGPLPPDTIIRRNVLTGLYTLGEWSLARGDTITPARVAARIRTVQSDPTADRISAIRADLFDAMLAARRRDPRALAIANRVDSLLRQGPGSIPPYLENLVLGHVYGQLGQPARGLAAVRRRMPDASLLAISQFLMEEARLALQAGDRGAAQRAFTQLQAIVYNPDPEVARPLADLRRDLGLTDR
jgi:hypothetical protein